MHCILGHNIHGECFKLIPSPGDAFLSLLKAPLLGPSELKLHNMDDIFCSFACLHLFVLLSLLDFHHLNPLTLSFRQDQKQIYSCMLSLVRSTYSMGNTPNSFILSNLSFLDGDVCLHFTISYVPVNWFMFPPFHSTKDHPDDLKKDYLICQIWFGFLNCKK